MDVFQLRDSVISDYQRFIQGFLHIRDKRIRDVVEETVDVRKASSEVRNRSIKPSLSSLMS